MHMGVPAAVQRRAVAEAARSANLTPLFVLGMQARCLKKCPKEEFLKILTFFSLFFVCLHLSQRDNREIMAISRILILLFTEEMTKPSPTTTLRRSTPLGPCSHFGLWMYHSSHLCLTNNICSHIQVFKCFFNILVFE